MISESQTDAYVGIVSGKVKAGDVVVIRYEGPRDGPGKQEMLAPTSAIKRVGLDDKVALITDGRFSGGTAGACIRHISPEVAAGGPIGLLEPGDIIDIDIPGDKLNVRLSVKELARRAKTWTAPMVRRVPAADSRFRLPPPIPDPRPPLPALGDAHLARAAGAWNSPARRHEVPG